MVIDEGGTPTEAAVAMLYLERHGSSGGGRGERLFREVDEQIVTNLSSLGLMQLTLDKGLRVASEELHVEFDRVGEEVARLRRVGPHQMSEEEQALLKQHERAVLSLDLAEKEYATLQELSESLRAEAAGPQAIRSRTSKQKAAQVAELKSKAKYEAIKVLQAQP